MGISSFSFSLHPSLPHHGLHQKGTKLIKAQPDLPTLWAYRKGELKSNFIWPIKGRRHTVHSWGTKSCPKLNSTFNRIGPKPLLLQPKKAMTLVTSYPPGWEPARV